MTTLHYVTLDVFTTTPFAGNPLGVIFLPSSTSLTTEQKQTIAREINYSETIFVHPEEAGASRKRRIDIFTTTSELPFAGHPTIGAASWFLTLAPTAGTQPSDNKTVDTIITKAGEIPISLVHNGSGDAAAAASLPHDFRLHRRRFPLSELLRLHPTLETYFQSAQTKKEDISFPVASIVKGMSQILVELPSLDALAAVTAATGGELVAARSASEGGYLDDEPGWAGSGLLVIYFYVRDVADDSNPDRKVIMSRAFLGSLEDPATGSAASGLAVYLALAQESGGHATRRRFDIVQGVEMGRRSDIGLEVVLTDDAKAVQSVHLSGSSVKIAEGDVRVP
ncbi:hypothetical protein VTN31DRAFT_4131 [Thermomyces dupontii]|uniref:uncharacterized protein n=1 Tax=Talaromyces thermophilus TaxID=28565 RepID=UPI003743A49F